LLPAINHAVSTIQAARTHQKGVILIGSANTDTLSQDPTLQTLLDDWTNRWPLLKTGTKELRKGMDVGRSF